LFIRKTNKVLNFILAGNLIILSGEIQLTGLKNGR